MNVARTSAVMPGLVPGIPIPRALSVSFGIAGTKPGNDVCA
jgi:hypothetical protein